MKYVMMNNVFTEYMKVGDAYDFIYKGEQIGSCVVLEKNTGHVTLEFDDAAHLAYDRFKSQMFNMMVPRGHLNSEVLSVPAPQIFDMTMREDMNSHSVNASNYRVCPYCRVSHHYMVHHECGGMWTKVVSPVPAPKFSDMSNEQLSQEIYHCSGILNDAIKLANAGMRNRLINKIGEYRTDLRIELHRREKEGACMHRNKQVTSLGVNSEYKCLDCGVNL